VSATDEFVQLRVLETLSDAVNYNGWLADLTLPYLGDRPLEIGSGLGSFARIWLERGVPRITVSEQEPAGAATLADEFEGDGRVEVRQVDVLRPPQDLRDFTSVVALNVLEHIENHVAALTAMRSLVLPGGAVVLIVPAHEWAMSRFDRSIGHFRRYTTGLLGGAFERAGLEPETVRYVNPAGLIAWLVVMRLLRRAPTNGATVRLYDRLVVPLARRADRRVSLPFGQSVLGVARRRD
jgi:SAM-dependent methyltransferase